MAATGMPPGLPCCGNESPHLRTRAGAHVVGTNKLTDQWPANACRRWDRLLQCSKPGAVYRLELGRQPCVCPGDAPRLTANLLFFNNSTPEMGCIPAMAGTAMVQSEPLRPGPHPGPDNPRILAPRKMGNAATRLGKRNCSGFRLAGVGVAAANCGPDPLPRIPRAPARWHWGVVYASAQTSCGNRAITRLWG